MKEVLAFDDVLIVPKFSNVKSRKDVDLSSKIGITELKLPVISSNMDTVTESTMTNAMVESGGVGCLHRFMSIEDNVKMFKASPINTWCSIGLGSEELKRANSLITAGCTTIVIDVAHGASEETVNQFNNLYFLYKNDIDIIIGNFATADEINKFLRMTPGTPAAFKVGIGGGSACSTRIKTGCGLPTFESILDCSTTGAVIIADGGMRTPGDVAKALAAGASAVMLGGMLAGTDESPPVVQRKQDIKEITNRLPTLFFDPEFQRPQFFNYRGSASKESYEKQGKSEDWRTAEGESFEVPYKGSVKSVLRDIEGGLRSAFSYVGANNLKEFQERADFVKVTAAGATESKPHGKKE